MGLYGRMRRGNYDRYAGGLQSLTVAIAPKGDFPSGRDGIDYITIIGYKIIEINLKKIILKINAAIDGK